MNKSIRQQLEDAKAELQHYKDSVAKLEELHATPGAMEMYIKQNPAMGQWVAQCFASLVLSSENYTEVKFNVVDKSKDKWEWITVLVQKGNGKTPHELRRIAEEERDQLKKILDSTLLS